MTIERPETIDEYIAFIARKNAKNIPATAINELAPKIELRPAMSAQNIPMRAAFEIHLSGRWWGTAWPEFLGSHGIRYKILDIAGDHVKQSHDYYAHVVALNRGRRRIPARALIPFKAAELIISGELIDPDVIRERNRIEEDTRRRARELWDARAGERRRRDRLHDKAEELFDACCIALSIMEHFLTGSPPPARKDVDRWVRHVRGLIKIIETDDPAKGDGTDDT